VCWLRSYSEAVQQQALAEMALRKQSKPFFCKISPPPEHFSSGKSAKRRLSSTSSSSLASDSTEMSSLEYDSDSISDVDISI
jgi:hypothetical protein